MGGVEEADLRLGVFERQRPNFIEGRSVMFSNMRRLREAGKIDSYRIAGEANPWPAPFAAGMSYDVWTKVTDEDERESLRVEIARHLETEPGKVTLLPSE